MATVKKAFHFMTYRKQRESRNQGPAINLKGTYPVTYFLMLGSPTFPVTSRIPPTAEYLA